MKGTFAQAELHIIRARLHGGKLNKARKGELRFSLPVGYVFDGDKIALDPDQEVQGAVRAVFELFEREGSAYAVVQSFSELGLRFSASLLRRRLGRKAGLGPVDAFMGPGSCWRIHAMPGPTYTDDTDPINKLLPMARSKRNCVACRRMNGTSPFPVIIPATSLGAIPR
jgi:hypothetical protein